MTSAVLLHAGFYLALPFFSEPKWPCNVLGVPVALQFLERAFGRIILQRAYVALHCSRRAFGPAIL